MLVLTMVGLASIEDIRPGDYVYAENTETGEQAYMPVLEIFSHEVSETYTVTIEGESIETTSGHPFYVVEEGWVGADELEAGDEVELADGDSGTVDSVEKNELDEPVTVYNFAVMDYHTYYVGENGALVHNDCTKPATGGESGSGSTTPGFDEWLNKGNADNKVYFGVDKNGNANYTGITKQAKDARLAQHNRNGKDFFDLEIQYDNLTRNQARAIEQYFIENGPNELNKINSIGGK